MPFDMSVAWNSETSTIELTSGQGRAVSGDAYYSADQVCWLSRIINAGAETSPCGARSRLER